MSKIELSEITDDNIFVAIFTGELKRQAIIEFIDMMNGYEDKHPGYGLLCDLINVAKVSVDFEDLKAVSAHLKEHDRSTGKTALLIGHNVSRFILAKLYTELTNPFRPNREKAFRNEEAALAWLRADPA